jgi:alginate O-acetyltransferase complex protein AlgI
MVFSDFRYLLLLGLIVLILQVVPRGAARFGATALIGLIFYVNLEPQHWHVLVAVSVTAYFGGLILTARKEGRTRDAAFVLLLISTLLPLLTYKYAAKLYGLLPPDSAAAADWSVMANLVLPIGISFYTFLALGYLIDIYVGSIPAERNIVRFGAFIWFFPHLTAGPIERARHLMPQLENLGSFDDARAVSGLRVILTGLFMKFVIADTLAPHVEAVYSNPRAHGAVDLVLATVYFSFQVYADFAGYSLIAIGSARMLGIELMTNFQQPWLSQTLPDFWRRWHISLSSWFRDYVFLPLQFQTRRYGAYGLASALVLTFVLVGIWHGAGLNFAMFGLIHGALVAFSTLTFTRRDRYWRSVGIPRWLLFVGRALTTFAIVSLTFVLFRASSLRDALYVYREMFVGLSVPRTVPLGIPAVAIATALALDLFAFFKADFTRLSGWMRWGIYYATVACVVVAAIDHASKSPANAQQFIYFKF